MGGLKAIALALAMGVGLSDAFFGQQGGSIRHGEKQHKQNQEMKWNPAGVGWMQGNAIRSDTPSGRGQKSLHYISTSRLLFFARPSCFTRADLLLAAR